MSNIKKGSKLTVSTANGISRATTTSLGVLEVSGPAMSDTTASYTENTSHIAIGATDVSGALKIGINNNGNTFIDAITHGSHKDIILQKYGGNTIFGSGLNSTAKVGIGTTNPHGKLHIQSNSSISDLIISDYPNSNYHSIFTVGGQYYDVYYKSSIKTGRTTGDGATCHINYYSGGDVSLCGRGIGNVGIGTTNPGAKLEVKGDALNNGAIFIKSYATTNKIFELKIRDDTTSSYPLHIGPKDSFEGININNSNGNVGIGTNDPKALLHIETNASNAGTSEGDELGSHNEIEALRISSYYNPGDVNSISSKISLLSDTNSQYAPHGKLLFYLNNSANGGNNYGYIPDNMVMSLVGSGNVGIGTTNPQNNLDVEGAAVIGATYSGTNTAPPNGLLVEGNVGIGTTSASNKLHVRSTYNVANYDVPQVLITADPASNYNQWASLELRGSYLGNPVTYGVGIRTTYGHNSNYRGYGDFNIWTVDRDNGNVITDRLRVTSEGNVGIGTSPGSAYKLHVNGNTKLQQTYVSKIIHHEHSGTGIWFDTADTLRFIINNKQRMIFDDNGRLGIGDNMGTTPICMLDISCNLNTTGISVKGAGIESNGKFQFILRAEGPDDSTQRVVHFLNSSTRTDDGGANTYTIRNDYGNLRLGNASYDTIINGNVGIGTTDPKAKLNVEDGGFLVGGIDNVTQQGCHIQWNRSGQHGETHIINNIGEATNNGESSGIKFAMTDSNGTVSDKMFIRNDGNVGIGTTNPLSLLTVGSHTLTNGTRDLIRLNSYRHNEAFTIRNNDDANTGRLEFFWGNTNNNTAQHDNTIDASILTMIHTGNVGIGTTDPKGADLMVNGYIKVVNGISFRNESNYDGTSINCSIHQRGHSVGDGIQFNGYSGLVFTTNNGVERMRITRVDGIGIGTTTPQYALDVHHDGATGFYSTYWNDTSTVSGNDDGTVFSTQSDSQFSNAAANYGQGRISDINSTFAYKISLHAQYGVYVSGGGFMTSSDRRIKKNIVDVSDNVALEMVKNIPCKYYTHIDERLKGSGKTIGFIAQEVAEVMPIAVKLKKEFIPSEMRVLENVTWNTNHLATDIIDCSGIKYKFFVSNDISNVPAKEVDVIGNADNTFTFDTSYNNIFCYGKEVDDFHALDKNKLFALNFSATQELIRKVESHENEIESLKMFNTESNNTLNNLIQENQQIKQENQQIKQENQQIKQQIQYIMQHLGL